MTMMSADDVRLALRRLVRHPGATAASVLALACGIGAASAAWSLLSAVLLNPLPVVAAPEQLFVIEGKAKDDRFTTHDYESYRLIREGAGVRQLAAGGTWPLLVNDTGPIPQSRTVFFASHDYFPTLGVRLAMGTGFRPEDDRKGATVVAVLSDRYWRGVFNAEPGILGRTIRVGDAPVTIVGVAPRGFRGLDLTEAPDLYVPLHAVGRLGDPQRNYFAEPIGPPGGPYVRDSPTAWVGVVARLDAGEQPAALTARLDRLPKDVVGYEGFQLTNVNTAVLAPEQRTSTVRFTSLLSATVGLLLLIGSLTVGMLLLVRTEDRRDELAVCLALGATRARLTRGIGAEGALLCGAGALLAVPIAGWLFAGLRTFQLPGGVEVALLELSIDRGAWAAAAALAVAATSLIVAIAGIVAFGTDTASALHARGAATPAVTRRRTRSILVAAQVAITLVLVLGAGLFTRSLVAALSLNSGLETTRIARGNVALGPHGYTRDRANIFFEELRARLSRHPDIQSMAFTQGFGGMSPRGQMLVDKAPRRFPTLVAYVAVDDRYFRTMGMQLLAGRDFSPEDTLDAERVIIVSESLARLIENDGSPLGRDLTSASFGGRIIGVVSDVVVNVNARRPLAMYYPFTQEDVLAPNRTVVVRAAGATAAPAIRAVQSVVKEMEPRVTPSPILTLEEALANQMNPQRFGVYVLGALGGIALLLTVLGTYVMAASMAAIRKREMTIRAALGASGAKIGALVLRETVVLVGMGLLAGLALAWLGSGTIQAFLYGIPPLDPITLAAVSILILSLALLVSLRPALEAARVDFTRALREE